MPRPKTAVAFIDQLRAISIANLKQRGFLREAGLSFGSIWWNEQHVSRKQIVSIIVNTLTQQPHLSLSFDTESGIIKYEIRLVAVPSNLGKGKLWYFLCPHTNRRCRILYFHENRVVHRRELRRCYYFIQTMSQKARVGIRILKTLNDAESAIQHIGSKHFKKLYNGRRTKRWLLLNKRIRLANQYNALDIERLYLA